MLLLAIFTALIGTTLLEVYVVVQIGHAIGLLPMLALMVADAVIGSVLMRREGRATWRQLTATLGERRLPTREVLDGALILVGGAFLITPGFVTDLLGALLLLPPTRSFIRRRLQAHLRRRLLTGVTTAWLGGGRRRAAADRASGPYGAQPGDPEPARPGARTHRSPPRAGSKRQTGARARDGATRPYDIEGSAVEVDPGEHGR